MFSDDKTNFSHKVLLAERQVASLCKIFANKSATNIMSPIAIIRKSERFLGQFLKVSFPLMINVHQPFIKRWLVSLRLMEPASAADAGIHKNILESGTTTLVIQNKNMKDIMKIVKSSEELGLLLKGITETSVNETKQKIGKFLSMLLGTLRASLLENL